MGETGNKMTSMRIKALWLFTVTVTAIIILLGAGCDGSNRPAKAGPHISFDLSGEPVALDPAIVYDNAGKQLINMLFEGLVRLKPDGSYEKAMAADWLIENQGLKYTFTIRNARWSNGDKVTAHDFEYAWKRILDPVANNPYAYMLYNIKNAQGYHRSQDTGYYGKKRGPEEVGIKALNDSVFVIELVKQDPALITKLIHPVFLPLPQKCAEELDQKFFTAENIVGNGPFVIASHYTGKYYELAKNMNYWDRETVKLEKITLLINDPEKTDSWEMYNRKELDVTVRIPPERIPVGLRRGVLQAAPLYANYFYEFNTAKPPFHDLRVRKAFSYCLNRETMVSQVLQGGQNPARGPTPQGMADLLPGSDFRRQDDNLVPDNDPEEARKLLAEAGYPGGTGFPRLQLVIDDKESHLYLATYLQGEWKKQLGVEIEIIPLNWRERAEKMENGEFDMALLGWVADYVDATVFLERYVTHSANNHTGWGNPDFDENIRLAAGLLNEEMRLEHLHRAETLLMSELPILPLFDYTRIYAAHKWVKGCFLPPVGPEVEFKWAYVEYNGR